MPREKRIHSREESRRSSDKETARDVLLTECSRPFPIEVEGAREVLGGASTQQTRVDEVLHDRQYPMTRPFPLAVEAVPLAAPADEDIDELLERGEVARHVAFHDVWLPAVVRLDLLEFQLAGDRDVAVTESHLHADAGLYLVLEEKRIVRFVRGVSVRSVAVGTDVHREAHTLQELEVKRQLGPVAGNFVAWNMDQLLAVCSSQGVYDSRGRDRSLRGSGSGS